MKNKKKILFIITGIIIVLVSLTSIYKDKLISKKIDCKLKGGFFQDDKLDEYDDDELCGICIFEDKKAENVKLIDKKDKERFGYNFYKMDGKVFVDDRELKEFDLETFTVLGHTTFAKDKNNVYVDGDILKGADVETFVVGEYTYNYAQLAMDKNNIYCYNWEKGWFQIKPRDEFDCCWDDKYDSKDKLIENTARSEKAFQNEMQYNEKMLNELEKSPEQMK